MKNTINWIGLWTVYKKEMDRTFRVIGQTLVAPVLTTSLYFIVFGAAIGSQIGMIEGVSYGQYIVPGLLMLALTTNALGAASSGIYFPKWIGTIYEMLTAPLSYLEITMGFVMAGVTRALMVAGLIYGVSLFFADFRIDNPLLTLTFIFLTAFSFSLFGFILGLWAKGFEQLSIVPTLVITPLTFLGGVFYSIDSLPEFWQVITLLNPFVYMINGLRYGFYSITDVDPLICIAVISAFAIVNLLVILRIFKTGYRLKP